MSQGTRHKFTRTFRKTSCERAVCLVFRDFGWVFRSLVILRQHTLSCRLPNLSLKTVATKRRKSQNDTAEKKSCPAVLLHVKFMRKVLHGVGADGVGVKFPIFAVKCSRLHLSPRRMRGKSRKQRKAKKNKKRKKGKFSPTPSTPTPLRTSRSCVATVCCGCCSQTEMYPVQNWQ